MAMCVGFEMYYWTDGRARVVHTNSISQHLQITFRSSHGCCESNAGSLRLLNHACFEHFPRFQQLAVIKIYVARPSINERALRLRLVITGARINPSRCTCRVPSVQHIHDISNSHISHRILWRALILCWLYAEWRNGNHTGVVSAGMLNEVRYMRWIFRLCVSQYIYAAPAQVAALQGWNSKQQIRMREQRFSYCLFTVI